MSHAEKSSFVSPDVLAEEDFAEAVAVAVVVVEAGALAVIVVEGKEGRGGCVTYMEFRTTPGSIHETAVSIPTVLVYAGTCSAPTDGAASLTVLPLCTAPVVTVNSTGCFTVTGKLFSFFFFLFTAMFFIISSIASMSLSDTGCVNAQIALLET